MKKVFIAIPAYSGSVDVRCMHSLILSINELSKAGYTTQVSSLIGECYITQARNNLCAQFLMSDCDDMIFIDSDVFFDADVLLKLLEFPVSLVGAVYRKKDIFVSFPCKWETDDQGRAIGNPETKLVAATSIPTGLMRINRKVFQELQVKYPEFCQMGFWEFFRQGYLFRDGKFYGEDVAFCRYVTDAGIQIWIYPDANTGHIGKMDFEGNLHNFLSEMPTAMQLQWSKIDEEPKLIDMTAFTQAENAIGI